MSATCVYTVDLASILIHCRILGLPNEIRVVIVMKIWIANDEEEREGQGQVPDHVADVLDHVNDALDHVIVKNTAAEDKY